MTDLKWQDPPRAQRGTKSVKWAEIADALRDRPGEWALVHRQIYAGNGNASRLLGPGFEASCRKADDGKFDIYARFVGEQS